MPGKSEDELPIHIIIHVMRLVHLLSKNNFINLRGPKFFGNLRLAAKEYIPKYPGLMKLMAGRFYSIWVSLKIRILIQSAHGAYKATTSKLTAI